MSNRYFDWAASLSRLAKFTTARAEEVNSALDQASAGFEAAQVDIDRSIKLADGDNEITATSIARAGKVIGFDSSGNLDVVSVGGEYTGNWVTGHDYIKGQSFSDPSNGDIYVALDSHTSTTISADETAGKITLQLQVSTIVGYRNDAQTAATNAAASATSASNSATAATGSENAAATSASDAATSASLASTSESNASASASNAAGSEYAAAASASSASSSASSASTSATNAATSASNASTSATSANNSATSASSSASAASSSASGAATSATNAANSASSASSSASAASTSASNAATSESDSATNASNASASATLAQNWATQASGEVVPGQGYSAYKYAQDAAASAAAASGVAGPGTSVTADALAQWSGTTGTAINQVTLSGIVKLTSGVPSAAVAGTDYVVPSGSITGSAAKLTTARTINGTSFNGSANITTTQWGTARNITIGNSTQSVNGSAAVTYTLASIGAAQVGMIPSGSTSAIVLTDVGGAVSVAANITIPTNASVAIPVGACILLQCDSTARTITGPAASSLVLEGSAAAVTSFTLKANKGAVIRKTATDAWHVYGDVS